MNRRIKQWVCAVGISSVLACLAFMARDVMAACNAPDGTLFEIDTVTVTADKTIYAIGETGIFNCAVTTMGTGYETNLDITWSGGGVSGTGPAIANVLSVPGVQTITADVSGIPTNGICHASSSVVVTVLKVDLEIHNGLDGDSGGQLISETDEESVGAVTVANLNDTDGDGTTDKDDSDVSVSGANPPGRNEIDLMKLVLKKPVPDLGDKVKLRLVSGDVKIWAQSNKVTEIPLTSGEKEFNTSDLDTNLWIEARSVSTGLRDIVLELEYKGCKDTAKATAMWTQETDARHDSGDALWSDFTDPPSTYFTTYVSGPGFGLRTVSFYPQGVRNAIGIQYAVYPTGIVSFADVRFDISRRADGYQWQKTGTGSWIVVGSRISSNQVERANDDSDPLDESAAPNVNAVMYVIDAPGNVDPTAVADWWLMRCNFNEFMRVRFDGTKPAGNVVSGSRCSSNYLWHVRHRLQNAGGAWERTTGDAPETDENDVGPGTITVGTP